MPRLILILAMLVIPSAALRAEDAPPPAAAVPPVLASGAVAPAFKPEKWLKGEAVTAFDPKKVYIIECWPPGAGPVSRRFPT
jgi:hypothetical protein